MPAKKRVFIIEDQHLLALGMRKALEDSNFLFYCGQSNDARKAIASFSKAKPDLVVIDFALANAAGSHIFSEIKAAIPNSCILVVAQDLTASLIRRVKRAPVHGAISKASSIFEFVNSIHRIFENERVFALPGEDKKVRKKDALPQEILTPRELEVLEMLGRGMGTRLIASTLALRPKTVDAHCANIKAKLGARNGRELLKRAVLWTSAPR